MINRMVLFGATGDLAGRFLLPALASMRAAGTLPDEFVVIGAARQDWDDERFRNHAAERLAQNAPRVSNATREALVRSLRYRTIDVADAGSVSDLIRDAASFDITNSTGGGPVLAYLALPPATFPATVTALGSARMPPGSRIALEKPFGESLSSAIALNALVRKVIGRDAERIVFRVDHVLGMGTTQNLLAMRLANRALDAMWCGTHVEQVDVLWEETLALEGRAGYYDGAGALKDVMQNHMLQVLALVAMEPPVSLDEDELHDRKVEVLRSVRPLQPEDMRSRTRRARYTAGQVAGSNGQPGRRVPSYVDEEGVDPTRRTETFAEMVLELDSRRWAGTKFVLRAGKAMRTRWKGVVLRFRPLSHFAPNEMRIGLDGPCELTLQLTSGFPKSQADWTPVTLTAPAPPADLPPYGNVLRDILQGGSLLSVRGDEAEAAWRVVMPVIEAWSDGLVPLEEYEAGSAGPPALLAGAEPRAQPARRALGDASAPA